LRKRSLSAQSDSDPDFIVHTIIERKTLSDLWISVCDGRFHEQLLRLSRTGLQVTYIIEGKEKADRRQRGGQFFTFDPKVYAGVLNELWLRGAFVIHTESSNDTAFHLSRMADVILARLRTSENDVIAWPFLAYQNVFQHTNKTATIGGTWARMLLQIPGVGKRKAMAIVAEYPTLSSLLRRYATLSAADARDLLSDLRCDDNAQRIGPKGSRLIYEMLTAKDYDD
jgi:ERCC4-type nuclease